MEIVQRFCSAFRVACASAVLISAGCGGSNGANGLVPPGATSGATTLTTMNASTPSSTPHYTFVALPPAFAAVSIMRDGAIAGSVGDQAAVYRSGHITLLGHYSGFANNTVATSVNDAGNAVGYAIANPLFLGSPTVALYFSHGHLTVLHQVSPETIDTATSINDNNQIVGTCTDSFSENMGFIPNLCTFHLGGVGSVIGSGAMGNINSHGEYAFSFNDYNNNNLINSFAAARGNGANTQELFAIRVVGNNILQNTASWINDFGNIVGSTQQVKTPNVTNAYILESGHLALITAPSSQCTNATGINSSNQVVGNAGSSAIAAGDTFACAGSGFLWESGHLYNLNAVVSGHSLSLNNAIGIDDRGDILAKATSGKAYLLMP